MDSNRIDNNNRIDGKLVTLAIGWIGLALSMIGVPMLWYCYGDTILFIIVYIYGQKYAKIWLSQIIIACFFYFASCLLWLWAIVKNKNTKFMAVALLWWWMMLSLWIRLVTATGELSFYIITLFLLAYFIVAIASFVSTRKPFESMFKIDISWATSSTANESVDPLLVP